MSFKKIAMTLALILSTVAAVAQTKTVKGCDLRGGDWRAYAGSDGLRRGFHPRCDDRP